jgi:3-keto-5-aminohexanoate cleavage enzyme
MVRALPEGTVWSGAGIGRFQFYVNSMAITMGGHIRVGLEDNLFFDPLERTQPATNAGLIDRAVKVARAVNRDVASPEEARLIIGIHPSQLSKS